MICYTKLIELWEALELKYACVKKEKDLFNLCIWKKKIFM